MEHMGGAFHNEAKLIRAYGWLPAPDFVMPPFAAAALTAVTVGLALHAWHNAAALPAGADIDKKANTRYVVCAGVRVPLGLTSWGGEGPADSGLA